VGRYAEKTSVSVAKSKAEIEKTLGRYGAEGFAYGCEAQKATVGFRMHGKYVRFNLALPERAERRFTHTPSTEVARSGSQAEKAWEQACRAAWRSLNLVIKAKLEAVETGITSFEEEFLSYLMLPNGETVGEHLIPQIEDSYAGSNSMPKLLPYGG
jgi:hypothetical protein